jgi:hypothetical protein
MIRVVLPTHLRTLAGVNREIPPNGRYSTLSKFAIRSCEGLSGTRPPCGAVLSCVSSVAKTIFLTSRPTHCFPMPSRTARSHSSSSARWREAEGLEDDETVGRELWSASGEIVPSLSNSQVVGFTPICLRRHRRKSSDVRGGADRGQAGLSRVTRKGDTCRPFRKDRAGGWRRITSGTRLKRSLASTPAVCPHTRA